MKPIIQSRKHYIQVNLTTETTLATINAEQIILAVAPSAVNTAKEVETGSIVKAVYVEMWLTSDDTAGSSFVMSLEKVDGGVPAAMTYTQSIDLENYVNKKNILYTTMGLVGPNDEQPLPLIRQWFKIPKGKQRFGLGDTFRLNISAITNGLTWCGFFTYKEYS